MTDNRAPESTLRRRPQPDTDRIPPHSIPAEEALLGAAMLSPVALDVLASRVGPEAFYKPAHGLIAAALHHAHARGWAADPVTIADELGRRGHLDTAGGLKALVELQSSTPATSSADRYATIILDRATLRGLLGVAADVTATAYNGHDAADAVARARDLIGRIADVTDAEHPTSLDVADVGAILDGSLEPDEPAFLVRNDGRALIYPGKMHVLQAEPTSGKTWIALYIILEALAAGGSAIFLDWEDTGRGIVGRLLALGADPAAVRDRFAYVQPSGGLGPAEMAELVRLLGRVNPDVVVIDAIAEALARDGLQEDKASEVVGWIDKLPRMIARTGAAVVMLDHVAKDPEARGRWARGSGAKLAVVDGATYIVRTVRSFSRTRSGELKLYIAKDKPGAVGAIGDCAAVVKVDPHAGERVVLTVEVDTGDRAPTDSWKPTVLMRRISEELAKSTAPLTATGLKAVVHSDKPRIVAEALARLIQEGYVVEVGKRPKLLRLVKPYTGFPDEPPAPPHPALTLLDDPSVDPETGRPYEVLDDPPDNVTRGPWKSPVIGSPDDPNDPIGF